MSTINFFLEDTNYKIRKKTLIRKWVLATIKAEKESLDTLNLILTSDNYLHQLNIEHLNHDTLTDIITFEYSEEGEPITSDIFISIDRVKENAKKFKQRQLDEFHRIIIHGTLHLLGYKDKNKADKELMTTKEDYYLSLRPEDLLKY
ncbi:MAG: rRNA maturation RNase YbeY [Bacteroidetes bacterium 4572_112]|nr:MAG: rRNA maturation RNase YbeY [Bacteroidetes bacterium 4572_112]